MAIPGKGWTWAAAVLVGVAPIAGTHQAQAADLLFQAEAQSLAGTCAGQAVRLEGNHDTVTLSGTCNSLLVKGVGNTIQMAIAPGGSIRVEGSDNQVRYVSVGAGPIIETFGPNNAVTPGAPARPTPVVVPPPAAAMPSPPPAIAPGGRPAALDLSGDDQERLADCAGRDVVVSGNRSAYVIRGACHSLVVRGDLLTVQAIVEPGARITVTGRGSVVSWAIQGRGRAPVAIVRGPGSRVQRAESIGGETVR